MHKNVKTAIKILLPVSGAYVYFQTIKKSKTTKPATNSTDAVIIEMVTEILAGEYNDIPHTKEAFDAIFQAKLELYTK